MIGSATFSEDGKYRYNLTREWDEDRDKICFVMLNPSLADGRHTDNTIRRCINFAKEWGYGGIEVVNLFAYITPYPTELKKALDPVGAKNPRFVRDAVKRSDRVIAAWGNLGDLSELALESIDFKLFKNLECLKMNKTGAPAHPLYLSSKLKPQRFELKKVA